jgi:hypothetical protein
MPQTSENRLMEPCELEAREGPQAVCSCAFCALRRIHVDPAAPPYKQEVGGSIPSPPIA